MRFLREKYIAIYTIDVGGMRQRIGKKRFKPTAKLITFRKDGPYPINLNEANYRSGRKIIYIFERGKGQYVGQSSKLSGTEPVLKTLFFDELPKQLVSGMERKSLLDFDVLIFVLLSLIAGAGLGYIIAGVA